MANSMDKPDPEHSTCLGCGGQFADIEGPTHRYIESSAGCWRCYGDVLAKEYSDPRYFVVHRLTVDAYALQHPGKPSPQSIGSVALHGISLCAVLEEGMDLHRATGLIQQATQNRDRFEWLIPPSSMGSLTVREINQADNAEQHIQLVWQWAESTWLAWSEYHAIFRRWMFASWDS